MTQRISDLTDLLDTLRSTRFTMFITSQGDGMRARPMTMLEASDDGSLWFFGVRRSDLVREVEADEQIALAYADNSHSSYAFVKGTAHLREDRAKVDELWNPIHKAWYDGPDDPDLQLIEVRIGSAEYWESSDSGVVRILGIVKAAITGEEHDVGEHGTVRVGASGS